MWKSFLKFTVCVICITFSIVSCSNREERPLTASEKYSNYQYATKKMIPPENKAAFAEFVTKTVSASNSHMTGGDYEDPEDVVRQAQYTGESIYETNVEGLKIYRVNERSWVWVFVPKDELTPKQLTAFNELKNAQ